MIIASRFLRLTTPPMSGPDVIAVQRRLTVLGFYNGSSDGIYGQATANSVTAFQSANGLQPDGIVGPHTWVALGIGQVDWGGGRYHIVVDTERNFLALYTTNVLTATYRVATGKPSTPTPIGNWVIIEKEPNPGGPFGSAWMRLSVPNGGYAIHGNDDPTSIGQSVSHGCVRLANADAATVFDTVPLGTLVTVTGQLATTRLLYRGTTPGSDIAEVQEMLRVLGYYTGPTDGVYGTLTQAAVQAFQRAYQLTPDGVVGPQTIVAIQSRYDIALGDVEP
ncbi:peptidoglycan-binding protein [Alicyclobacillus fastidiosus]|uniref:Peptidoglycan-binding protein n=1 Tax=Alicyclobacillus fastidiosus TaxID=392011 RepID=A0ABY6ZG20_9BACL|nr:peptidoglycan-binding protein [Alicyclobacillus fastidiosus]WAH41523.1 peptidoglycan-binding protein [Alicyclobacillus fastidiosus]GMA63176.1 hypothetical protein GCM10025859_36160 [Alicyclobacillus fastidiosus]